MDSSCAILLPDAVWNLVESIKMEDRGFLQVTFLNTRQSCIDSGYKHAMTYNCVEISLLQFASLTKYDFKYALEQFSYFIGITFINHLGFGFDRLATY